MALLFLVLAALCKLESVFVIKFLVSVLIKRVADFLHKLVIEIEVMKHRKTHTERLLCLEKVTDICARILTAGRTRAAL